MPSRLEGLLANHSSLILIFKDDWRLQSAWTRHLNFGILKIEAKLILEWKLLTLLEIQFT